MLVVSRRILEGLAGGGTYRAMCVRSFARDGRASPGVVVGGWVLGCGCF